MVVNEVFYGFYLVQIDRYKIKILIMIMIRQFLSSNYLLRSLIHPRFKTNNYKVIKASLYLNAQPAYYSAGQKILGDFTL